MGRGLTLAPEHADIPLRRHAQHGAHDAAPRREERRKAKGEVLRLVIVLRLVAQPVAAAEQKVLLDEHGREDREPVAQQHEQRVEPRLEVRRTDDGEHDVHDRPQQHEEHARDALRERPQHLERQRERVHVRDVVPHDAQREQHHQELAEAARGRERRGEQAADAAVRVHLLPVRARDRRLGRAEALDEDARQVEPGVRQPEHTRARHVLRQVHGVVCGERRPAEPEADDRGGEGQHGRGLGGPRRAQGRGVHVLRGEAERDEEDDGDGDPGVALVEVHVAVAEEREDHGEQRDDHDRGGLGDLVRGRDGAQGLPADDGVDRRPADARDDVEHDGQQRDVVPEAEPRDRHLAQPEAGPEDGEVGDGDGAEEVEEEDGEAGLLQPETEDRGAKCPEREGRDCRVSSKPPGLKFSVSGST